MKRRILIAFYFLMTYLGVIHIFYWINRKKKIVLTYHNVIPDELFDHTCHLGVSHSEGAFTKQVQLIRRRFKLDSIGKISGRCLITFDDGYKNQLEIAARILNQQKLQGIFFISFQPLTTGQTLTIDKVMMWVSYVPPGNYKIFGVLVTVNDNSRHLVASQLYEQLIKKFELWDVIEDELNQLFLFDDLSINPELIRLRFKPFEFEDLETLVKEGHLVASHSWSHRPLGILSSEIQKEDFLACVSFAKKYCNSMLYSYPFGGTREVSPLTTKLCAEYGFSAAYMNISTLPTWINVNENYTLPRQSLPNEKNRYLLDAKLSGLEPFCKNLLRSLPLMRT